MTTMVLKPRKAQFAQVDCVVSLSPQPLDHSCRDPHVCQELHVQAVLTSSCDSQAAYSKAC
jgi:hypothetical protein